jgi:hypothetical protein
VIAVRQHATRTLLAIVPNGTAAAPNRMQPCDRRDAPKHCPIMTLKRTGVLGLAVWTGLAVRLVAQHPPRNRISLALGLGYDVSGDRLASPFNYHGVAVPLTLGFAHRGRKTRLDAWAGLAVNTLRSRITGSLGSPSHQADQALITFGLGYARPVHSFGGGAVALLGAAWDNVFDLRSYDYGRGLDKETFGEVYSSLSLRGVLERALGDRATARLTLDAAPVAFAYRNPYGISTDQQGDVLTYHGYLGAFLRLASLQTLDRFFAAHTQVSLDYRLGGHARLDATYGLRYSHFARPRPSTTVHGALRAAIAYAF